MLCCENNSHLDHVDHLLQSKITQGTINVFIE